MREQDAKNRKNPEIENFLRHIFWPAIILSVLFYFSDHALLSDEGMVLNASWQIYNGKKMYIDFIEYVSPGSAYAIFWLWKIFGTPSYLAAKLLIMAGWIFSAVGIARIVSLFTDRKLTAMAAVVLWLFAFRTYPLINHNTLSSIAAVWALYFLLRPVIGIGPPRLKHWILAGCFTALTFCFLQTKGLAVFLCGCIAVFAGGQKKYKQKINDLLLYITPFLLSILALFLVWQPATLWHYLIVFPNRFGYMSHTYIAPLYIILEILISIAMIGYGIKAKSRPMAVLGIFQAALFASSGNIVEICHFAVNSFGFWIFLAVVSEKAINRSKRPKLLFISLISTCLAVCFVFIYLTLRFLKIDLIKVNLLTVDVLHKAEPLDIFENEKIKNARYIYSGPFMPGLYHYLGKENPFFMSNMLLCDQACQNKTLEIFKEVKPDFAFLNYSLNDLLGYDPRNILDKYIINNYNYCEGLSMKKLYTFSRERCPSVN